jgi:GNAT superfamily N-acetyltransferase
MVDELDPHDPRVAAALRAYMSEVLTVCGMNGTSLVDAARDVEDYCPPTGAFLGVLEGQAVVACVGLRRLQEGVGEIKRMWVAPAARGRGLGSALLGAVEQRALLLGFDAVRLDTHDGLTAAIALYADHGYREIPAYNDNPDATHFFEKRLRTI